MIYDSNGNVKVTVVDGNTRTGPQASDGSINVVINDGSSRTGIHHPCGAYNVIVVTEYSAPYNTINGSIQIVSDGNGGYVLASPLHPAPSGGGEDTGGQFDFTSVNNSSLIILLEDI